MRIGSVFSGTGILDAAIAANDRDARIEWQIDVEPFTTALRRVRFPEVRQIEAPVQSLTSADLSPVDLLIGGFPCQDLSSAGKRAGIEGERTGLYRELLRLARAIAPTWVLMENVPAVRRHLDDLAADWNAIGYGLGWVTVRASDVGAPHLRERIFLVADRGIAGLRKVPLYRGGRVPAPFTGRPWPTPVRRDYKTGDLPNREGSPALSALVGAPRMGLWGRMLNPDWVDALMGLPVGWTDPRVPTSPLSMFPAWPREAPPRGVSAGSWKQASWEPPRTLPDGTRDRLRSPRLRALGNAVVPQAASLAFLSYLIDRTA